MKNVPSALNPGAARPRALGGELSPEALDLLSAIRDALDIPLPGLRPEDESAYHRLTERRANIVRCTLQGLLAHPGPLTRGTAEHIRASVALSPVTYVTYVPDGRLTPA